jgi:hypothetical protein
MLHGKQAPTKPKHRRKALPVLGAAGLSLSLAGATTAAAIGGASDRHADAKRRRESRNQPL